jgi:predicted kinase
MSRVHLIVGPVGSGKSTFARSLCREHRAMRLGLDDWMARLFRPDRPETGLVAWYAERAERCVDQIWAVAQDVLDLGTPVVLEIGLIQRAQRQRFYERIDGSGYPLTIHVLDAPRAVRRERVARRNREQGETFSMVVPPEIFELASDMWQPLDDAECADRDVRFHGAAE